MACSGGNIKKEDVKGIYDVCLLLLRFPVLRWIFSDDTVLMAVYVLDSGYDLLHYHEARSQSRESLGEGFEEEA